MSAVVVEDLTMRYRGHTALSGVNLTLEPDTIHGLLGRNGAGKTTLMRILTGREFETSGRVEVFGQPPRENPLVLDRVCFIGESQKYPNAQLAVARNAIKFPAEGQSSEGTVPATLALHGKSKTVPVHYTATRKGKAYDVKGDLKVDFREFGIEIPNYLGATVKPPVDVNVAFTLDET